MTQKGVSPYFSNAVASTTKIVRGNNHRSVVNDEVIVEAPLQIQLQQIDQKIPVATIMRTPGDDHALALGFLFSENIIKQGSDVTSIGSEQENEIILTIAADIPLDVQALSRPFVSYSGCGICGKTTLKQLALQQHRAIDESKHWLPFDSLLEHASLLSSRQQLFQKTGGVHGAALLQRQGNTLVLLDCKEDVGRHNAVDKLVGKHLLSTLPSQNVLLLSGRISFELVQKAVMAGISVIAAIGAPSSLAIQTAKQFNLTLIGFMQTSQANIYCGDWRLQENSQEFSNDNI